MANEIYNTSWWGNALDTARTAGTDPDFFGSQMKLLTSEQDNLITNGDFSNGLTNWYVDDGTSWTNVNNTAFCDGNNGFIAQNHTSTQNKVYKVTFDSVATNSSGKELGIRIASGTYAWNLYPTGTHTIYLTAGSNNTQGILFYATNGWTGSIDNVSVQLVRCDYDGVSGELVQNGSFNQIGSEEVSNGDFSQIGNEQVSNGDFSQIGSELITGFTNGTTYDFTTFETYGNNITSAIVSSDFAGAVSNAMTLVSNKTYNVTFNYIKNSGDDLRVLFSSSNNGAGTQISNNHLISESGSYTKTFTVTSSGTGYLQMGTGNASHSLNVSITSVSVKEVGQNWSSINPANGWSISNTLNFTNASSYVFQNVGTVQNKHYKVVLDLELTSGTLIVKSFNSQDIFVVNTTGRQTLTGYFTEVDSNNNFGFIPNGSNVTGKIHSLSIKEVGQDWTLGTGWSISSDKANCDGTQVSNSIFYQNIGNQSNKTVKFSFTISDYVSGVLETAFFGASGTIAETISANGNYTFYVAVQSGHNGNTGFTAKVGFIGSIDNISVKEVGQGWTLGTGWSMGDGKAIKSSSVGSGTYCQQTISSLVDDKLYQIQFDLNIISGLTTIGLSNSGAFGNLSGDLRFYTTSGTKIIRAKYDNSYPNYIRFVGGLNTGYEITNVSIISLEDHVEAKKCLADWIHRTALEDLKY